MTAAGTSYAALLARTEQQERVAELLAGTAAEEERAELEWPVVVVETHYRIAWVEAESSDEAVAWVREDMGDCVDWKADPIRAEANVADKFDAEIVLRYDLNDRYGPHPACTLCGTVSTTVHREDLHHPHGCPEHQHFPQMRQRYDALRTWVATCADFGCIDGFGMPLLTPALGRDALEAHLAGKKVHRAAKWAAR